MESSINSTAFCYEHKYLFEKDFTSEEWHEYIIDWEKNSQACTNIVIFCWLHNCSLPQMLWDLLSGRNKIVGCYLTTILAVICIYQLLNILISGGWVGGSLGKSVRVYFTDSYFFSKHLLLVIHRQCWSGLNLCEIWFSHAYVLFWGK